MNAGLRVQVLRWCSVVFGGALLAAPALAEPPATPSVDVPAQPPAPDPAPTPPSSPPPSSPTPASPPSPPPSSAPPPNLTFPGAPAARQDLSPKLGMSLLGGSLMGLATEIPVSDRGAIELGVGPRFGLGESLYANLMVTGGFSLMVFQRPDRAAQHGFFFRGGASAPTNFFEVLVTGGWAVRWFDTNTDVQTGFDLGLGYFPVRELPTANLVNERVLFHVGFTVLWDLTPDGPDRSGTTMG